MTKFWKKFLIAFASALGVAGGIALAIKILKPKFWVIEIKEEQL